MKRTHFLPRALAVLGLIAALSAVGCRRAKPADALAGVQLGCQVNPQPPRVGPATVAVELTGADGKPVTGATLRVEGNMNHAGMKPVFGDAREVRPGRYEAHLEFSMGGDWFLLLNVTLPDGRSATRKVDVPGVKEG
jgi:hypothetical protein